MIPHIILAASLMTAQTSSLQVKPNPADGLAELRAIHCADDLGALRAGAPALVRPIDDQERAELRAAADDSADLAALRAGMTDHDWLVVGAVLLGILLLIVIF